MLDWHEVRHFALWVVDDGCYFFGQVWVCCWFRSDINLEILLLKTSRRSRSKLMDAIYVVSFGFWLILDRGKVQGCGNFSKDLAHDWSCCSISNMFSLLFHLVMGDLKYILFCYSLFFCEIVIISVFPTASAELIRHLIHSTDSSKSW